MTAGEMQTGTRMQNIPYCGQLLSGRSDATLTPHRQPFCVFAEMPAEMYPATNVFKTYGRLNAPLMVARHCRLVMSAMRSEFTAMSVGAGPHRDVLNVIPVLPSVDLNIPPTAVLTLLQPATMAKPTA